MALKCIDEGEVLALEYMLNKTEPTDLILRLYTSNTSPAEGDTLATYTECDATGYAEKTLTGASWTVATVANVTTGTYAAQEFTLTEAATIYGYYIVDGTDTTCIIAERFTGAPFNIPAGGGSVTVTLKITLD